MSNAAPLLGVVADDTTGATDIAAMLARNGMRAVQVIGVPRDDDAIDADAIVVALKSRTAPLAQAIAESRASLAWLRRAGCRQFFFKYCSTFDSTDEGNIGPVAEALLADLGAGFALACPAFPANARSVYAGHLFVGDRLLNESGMEHHPLTPMTDANLVRVLGRQTTAPVGLVPFATVRQGAGAIRGAMTRLAEQGRRFAIVDAVGDEDLHAIGEAAAAHPLITGGSGVAMGLPENFRRAGLLPRREDAMDLPPCPGFAAVLAGSCSRATLMQIGHARSRFPLFEIDPLAHRTTEAMAEAALDWARPQLGERPVMIAASAPPDRVAEIQSRLGREAAGALIEQALARVAEGLVAAGVRRIVVAGGETSGAIVARLGIRRLRIGREVAPGVPWTLAEGGGMTLKLVLKSGNFGGPAFFAEAFETP